MNRLYGSLNNRLMAASRQPEPVVGMGMTICHYTDRSCATIREVKHNAAGKAIAFSATGDRAIRVDDNGISESQQYRYETRDDVKPTRYTLRKNGKWGEVGIPMRYAGQLLLGVRDAYHDYSF